MPPTTILPDRIEINEIDKEIIVEEISGTSVAAEVEQKD